MIATALLALALGTATPVAPNENIRWAQVQLGATRDQVTAVLGEPLIRNSARGCERWVYDYGCEVFFTRGTVSAWTAPRGLPPVPAPLTRNDPPGFRRS